MDSILSVLAPYRTFIAAGFVACLVAITFDFLKGQPPGTAKKILEGVLCGFIAFAICGYGSKHFDWIEHSDSLYLAVGIGAIGAGRVTDIAIKLVCRKLNLKIGDDNDTKN